jgi:hypothetical protein
LHLLRAIINEHDFLSRKKTVPFLDKTACAWYHRSVKHEPTPLTEPIGVSITADARELLAQLDALAKQKAAEVEDIGSGRARGFAGRIVSRLLADHAGELAAVIDARGIEPLLRLP